ncbi:hypothetical protein ACFPRA_23555 [Sporosarcina soli]|uniref:Uncharacterized protein n=1 Tax=Sporosarcina soli TaxID=334736 RepID=A0ABW0TTT1_9BACL
MLKINMKRSKSEEQIAAFINISAVNAMFVIYEKKGDQYQEVYVNEQFVEGVKVVGGSSNNQILVVTGGGGGGTGIWQSDHHVVRYTPQGYKEVWKGIATNRENLPIANYHLQQNGMIGFDAGGSELYYAQITSVPTSSGLFQLYKYNEQKSEYELVISY